FDEAAAEFQSKYPTREDCTEDLFNKMAKHGLIGCHTCGCSAVRKAYGARTFTCNRCGGISWFTSRSFFCGIKIPRAWMAAIWLKERGVAVNPSRFAAFIGVTYSTAHAIFKKLGMIIQRQMDDNCALAPSLAFKKLVCKRSRETTARGHPATELD